MVCAAGCTDDNPEALLDLIRPSVTQVTEDGAPVLVGDLSEVADESLPQLVRDGFASAMFVPLRSTDR
ncbi:MAG: hypothetical protein JSW71_10435 [Gemmatimonadota bacterium]|nr:MAG: hypothetical protein JSW71_10435 [Gemmatimonadota bacterium]